MEVGLHFDLAGLLHHPRADCDVMPRFDRRTQLRDLVKPRAAVRIHEEHGTSVGVEHSHANGRTLTHVWTGEDAYPSIALFKQASERECFVPAAVVHDDELEVDVLSSAPLY